MEMTLFILGVIGFTDIMVNSTIMKPLRDWFAEPYLPPLGTCIKQFFTHPIVWFRENIIAKISDMMGCPQCCGFWCGLVLGWAVLPDLTALQIVAAGFSGSFLAVMASILMNFFEAQTVVNIPEEHRKDG